MKKLLAIAIVFLVGALAAYAQPVNNCHASGTGHFTFTVEAAITITADAGEVDLGGICPNCCETWLEGEMCLYWEVTGGVDCEFRFTHSTQGWPEGSTHVQYWEYLAEVNGQWGALQTFYPIGLDGWAQFRKCVTEVCVDCFITPGEYTVVYDVEVDYVCL